ncbi:hypothetical protein KCG44_11180 [Pacificimonas sp. WHA3]|uniref:Uncharacterized protein n=1 Tax=Pacificimonas pallii TaxID=2827236 RepID=A0ABS6SG02_9SPHN|nr:hypothetical protein [Pacificimonas pallii]MBV7257347.1 hypothetical protein [Pacificimonas pallii]
MSDPLLLTLGTIGAIGGIFLLRFSWGRRTRHGVLNLAAWAVLSAGVLCWAMAGGAWGIAIACCIAMLSAAPFLAQAAMVSKPPKRAEREVMDRIAATGTPDAGRRAGVFALVVPGALGLSVLVGLNGQALARLSGWHPADSTSFGLFLMPVTWAVVATFLLFRDGLFRMAAWLAGGVTLSAVLLAVLPRGG